MATFCLVLDGGTIFEDSSRRFTLGVVTRDDSAAKE